MGALVWAGSSGSERRAEFDPRPRNHTQLPGKSPIAERHELARGPPPHCRLVTKEEAPPSRSRVAAADMSRLKRLEPATLQLLGCVLVSALLLSAVPQSRACVPPQGEGVRTSPEWLAYQSPIVVDAKVAETLPPNPDSNRYNATFSIRNLRRNVFKGELSGRSKVITVAQFGAEKSCVDLKKGQRYFLFLDPLEEGSDVYRVHFNPVLFNKKDQKKIKKAVCKGCEKAPKIRGRLRPVKAAEGEEVQLKCNVQGRPFPAVTWKKDGELLQDLKLKGVQIKPSKRGSRVRIKKLLPIHEGTYECVAESPVPGDPATTKNTVTIKEPTPPETTTPTGTVSSTTPVKTPIFQLTTIPTQKTFTGHGIPCRDQDAGYCLNGGTCTQLPAPGAGNKFEKRCTCTDDYFGNRCQYAASIRELQARLRRMLSLFLP